MDDNKEYKDILEGKNPILEALNAGRQIDKLWVLLPENKRYDPLTYKIMKEAKDRGAVIVETNRNTLDRLSVTHSHQGMIARAAAHEYFELADMITSAKEKNEDPLIVILTGLKDPYNLGSVLRISDAAGVHGVVIPKHRSVGLDGAVAKTSAGAIEHVKVARVTNLSSFIDDIKEKGFWTYAADGSSEKSYDKVDYSGPAAIIIGSEGEGIPSNILKKCDFKVRIPMRGSINSLNAAVAAGIIIFESVKTHFAESIGNVKKRL